MGGDGDPGMGTSKIVSKVSKTKDELTISTFRLELTRAERPGFFGYP
jgi:hypothetical protein